MLQTAGQRGVDGEDGAVVGRAAREESVVDGDVARGGRRDGRGNGAGGGVEAVREQEDPPRGVGRDRLQRGVDRGGNVRDVRVHPRVDGLKLRERGNRFHLLFARERDHAEPGALRRGTVQRADQRVHFHVGILRHRPAPVRQHDERTGAFRQPDGHAAHGGRDHDVDEDSDGVQDAGREPPDGEEGEQREQDQEGGGLPDDQIFHARAPFRARRIWWSARSADARMRNTQATGRSIQKGVTARRSESRRKDAAPERSDSAA